ncbi:MAG TPA: hypothetical protein VME66_15750 [Candidatus Acidoferrales bacterium]|nr:hypothetical protein [Candidatus Acidoferrales bacterium]
MVRTFRFAWLVIAGSAAVALAACGQVGHMVPPSAGTSPTATLSPSPAPSSSAGALGTGTAHFTITDPYETAAPYPYSLSKARTMGTVRPQYFSPATQAIEIVINGTSNLLTLSATSPGCTVTAGNISCAVDIPEPNGPITFTARTLAENADLTFTTLSQTSGTATINGVTTIPLSLDGVWATAVATIASPNPVMGTPSTLTVNVAAYDARGALIIGPEAYASPIPLYDSDTSGATKLSASSVTSPSQTVTLSYDGTSFVNAVVSGGATPAPQSNAGPSMLVPTLNAVEYPIPSGNSAVTVTGASDLFVNPDGSMTFLENAAVGHVTTAGAITETALSQAPYEMAEGADQHPWLLTADPDGSDIDLTRDNEDGTFTSTRLANFAPLLSYLTGFMVLGSDGNFWVPSSGSPATPAPSASPSAAPSSAPAVSTLYRIQPTGAVTGYAVDYLDLTDSLAGPDGNLWFTSSSSSSGPGVVADILKVTTAGAATAYPLPASVTSCCGAFGPVFGPSGSLYLTTTNGQPNTQVQSMTTAGAFSVTATLPYLGNYSNTAAFGPDGALWIPIAEYGTCEPLFEHVTTTGQTALVELPFCTANSALPALPGAMVIGSDHNLWYTRGGAVGKITL